nr:element excision factor XisH family protein [Pseudanabaena mucicola]
MSARDLFHDIVKNALQKDGWTITHDPYPYIRSLLLNALCTRTSYPKSTLFNYLFNRI